MPLLKKSAHDVIGGLRVADELMPFRLQGLDTDCGSEFINYDVLDYCEDNRITFTRARTHRKNDQAHVEEKNGSVVRRLVGYDRFEGFKAWEALAKLYRVLRQYVNFFQPSLKLVEKERRGAKVSKKYDSAKTPFQRILLSDYICQSKKDLLSLEYERLDPVKLLARLEQLQDELWQYSWSKTGQSEAALTVTANDVIDQSESSTKQKPVQSRYYRSETKVDLRSAPRTYRTRKDPFEKTWDEIRLRLELKPDTGTNELIQWLIAKYPSDYSKGQTRTLQRRVAQWRQEQGSQEDRLRELMGSTLVTPLTYSITDTGMEPRLDLGKEHDEMTPPSV